MKKLLMAVALFVTLGLNAQTKFESAMQSGLAKMKESKTADEMNATASFFERVQTGNQRHVLCSDIQYKNKPA